MGLSVRMGITEAMIVAALAAASGRCAAADVAGGTHAPSNEDLRHVRALSSPQLSPDGQRVIVQIADTTADGGRTHLWIVDVAGGAARQVTYSPPADKTGEHGASWAPDGKTVLFLAKRGEQTQIWRLPMAGGEALAYETKAVPPVDASGLDDALPPRKPEDKPPARDPVDLDVERFAVAPAGRWIALVARDPETPGEKKQREEKADAVVHERDLHGKRLYLLDAETGKLSPTGVEPDVDTLAWRPQGDRLVALTDAPNGASDRGPARRAWLVATDDPAHPVVLKSLPPTAAQAAWSGDGATLYFHAQASGDAPPGYPALYALDTAGSRVDTLSTSSDDLVGAAPVALDEGVLQLVQQGTHTRYAHFGRGAARHLDDRGLVVQDLRTNAGHTGWVWLGSSATQPGALYYAATLDGQARRLDTPALLPERTALPPSQLVRWKSDGLDIEGLLYLPPQSAQARVPLIVDIHGGPTGAWVDAFDPLVAYLVGQGWAVLRPNPRGSTGYGQRFAAANRNDLGGGDYRDILGGVDFALAHYPIGADRLALIGYSYGGEMAAFVEGRTERFKAIVSGAPVIDQYSEYGTEDDSWYDRWFFGKPWEQPADAWRQSPLAGAAHARTPFLLLQGQSDETDPPGQSLEMYRALRQAGVPVELVEYPREGHGPLYAALDGRPSKEPWHGYDARRRLVHFIASAFATKPGVP